MLTLKEHVKSELDRKLRLHRECGDRGIDHYTRIGYERQATEEWWRMLEDAAWAGEEITDRVWQSAKFFNKSVALRLMGRHKNAAR